MIKEMFQSLGIVLSVGLLIGESLQLNFSVFLISEFWNLCLTLFYEQLPDSLPGLKPEIETAPVRPSATAKPSTSVTDQANSTSSSEVSYSFLTFDVLSALVSQ